MIRLLELAGAHVEMGQAHGAAHATEIKAYAEERISLVTSGLWSGHELSRADVLDIAQACVDHHGSFDPELTEEMEAIGRSAGLSLAEMIIVGGFTDFVDVVRGTTGGLYPPRVIEDDCTAVIIPDGRAEDGGYFAQTWDMHDTATQFVVLTDVAAHGKPRALVFTTTGCLGQLGMNELGVAVGINNLTALDGRPGVTWPHVVRKALQCETAAEARDVIMAAPVAGAHSYLVFDASGAGYNIEALPTKRAVFELAETPLVHTNHILHPSLQPLEVARPAELQHSSEARLARALELLEDGLIGEDRLMDLTRDAEAICQIARDPYRIESCGAAVMHPRSSVLWAVWGLPSENAYQRFTVGA